MSKTFKTRIVHKHETEAKWNLAVNFVPMKAELIVYDPDDNYNYVRFKIGDGITNVNDLPFVGNDLINGSIILNNDTNIAEGENSLSGGSDNEVISDESISFGIDNRVGYRVHKILAYDNTALTVTLDSDASTLAIGDTFSIDGGINYPYCGTITEINGDTITVDRQLVSYLDKKTPIDPVNNTLLLFVDGKPDTGNNALDGYAAAFGGENDAIAKGSFAAGRGNTAAGSYAVALGRTNTASSHSVAMGKDNRAKGMISVAIGVDNDTSDRFTVAMGQKNKATAPEAMAIGTHNKASGEGATALGWQSKAESFHSIAISGTASGIGSVAISGTAEGDYAIALGGNAKGENSVSLSDGAVAEGAYSLAASKGQAMGMTSTALGSGIAQKSYDLAANRETVASGGDSAAFGYKSQASGYASIATGSQTKAKGRHSFSGGQSSEARGENNFAFGRAVRTNADTNGQFAIGRHNVDVKDAMFIVGNGESDAAPSNAFVVMRDGSVKVSAMSEDANSVVTKSYVDSKNHLVTGPTSGYTGTATADYSATILGTASGIRSVAIGYLSKAEGTSSFAGPESTATGNYSAAFGRSTATGTGGFAAGTANTAGGDAVAFGNNTQATGYASMAIGGAAKAKSSYSFAGGQASEANNTHSFAFGKAVRTNSETPCQTAFGQFNKSIKDALFIIGNGESDAAKDNAFVVMKDGSATVKAMGTSDNSVATRKFVLDNMSGNCKLDALGKLEDYSFTDADGKLWNHFAFTGDHTIFRGKYMTLECSNTLSGVYVGPEGTTISAYDGTVDIWSSNGTSIHNVVTPTEDTDAVNKAYVDSITGSGELSRAVIILNEYQEVLKITYTNGDIKYILPTSASSLTGNEDYYEFDMTEELSQYGSYLSENYFISLTGFSKVAGWYVPTNYGDSIGIESPTYVSLYGTKIRTQNLKLYNLPEEYAYLGDTWTYQTSDIELNLYKKPTA